MISFRGKNENIGVFGWTTIVSIIHSQPDLAGISYVVR